MTLLNQRARLRARAANTGDDSPIRVLIATDTYPPDVNGAGYFTHRLAAGLAERGHDVHVVCASATGRPGIEHGCGVTEHRLRSVRMVAHSEMRTAVPMGISGHIARLVDRFAPHVVHAQSHFTISRTAIRRARQAGIPVVLTNHFMPENLFAHAHIPKKLHGLVGALAWQDMVRVAHEADYVTTPTRRAASLLAEQGFDRTVEAVSCGIDLERFHPRPSERAAARAKFGLPDRDTAVFVGRLDEEKRIDDLIRALPEVLRHRDLQLALVGIGQRKEELRRLATGLGVADRVHFLGFVSDADLPLAYAAADLFAICSVAELQSIATLEAMSTGLPIVAADALALPHLVDPGRNGYLYPPGDIHGLSEALIAVVESAERRTAMGAASRKIAGTHDHRSSLRRFEEIYTRIRTRPAAGLGRSSTGVPAEQRSQRQAIAA